MEVTGTPDAVETPTDTTDATDSVESPPVARPQPGMFTRSYDAFCGVACIVAGGYLLGRAFGLVNYPEVHHTWLSP